MSKLFCVLKTYYFDDEVIAVYENLEEAKTSLNELFDKSGDGMWIERVNGKPKYYTIEEINFEGSYWFE